MWGLDIVQGSGSSWMIHGFEQEYTSQVLFPKRDFTSTLLDSRKAGDHLILLRLESQISDKGSTLRIGDVYGSRSL